MEQSLSKKILLIDHNLFFVAGISDQIKKLGFELSVLTQTDKFESDSEVGIKCLLINLTNKNIDVIGLIKRFKDSGFSTVPVIGYCGHKEVQLREQAIIAGCNSVVTNKEITSKLQSILKKIN